MEENKKQQENRELCAVVELTGQEEQCVVGGQMHFEKGGYAGPCGKCGKAMEWFGGIAVCPHCEKNSE